MFDKFKDKDRGQVGIGTLIVFIAMVLVAAIAAGVLINTAGFLQSKSEQTGQQSGEQVTNRLQVLSTTGLVTAADAEKTIGAVEMTVTKAPGAEDIDLADVTMRWTDNKGTYVVISEDARATGNQDGRFVIEALKDEDNSETVVNSPDDRMRLTLDLGNSEEADANSDLQSRFQNADNDGHELTGSDPLGEGEEASIRITTESGTASTVTIIVPESLSGTSAVSL